jgi:DTW domain-containing protein YfiP
MTNRGGEPVETSAPTEGDTPPIDPTRSTAEWQKRWDFVQETRRYKEKLVAQGISGHKLWEAMSALALNHKLESLSQKQQNYRKCLECWHPQPHCICDRLVVLSVETYAGYDNVGIQLLILMHFKEYLSGGNSAKLLLRLLPKNTRLYVYGKQGEVDRLRKDITGRTFVLWPSDTALSVHEWMEQQEQQQCGSHNEGEDPPTSTHSTTRVQTIQAIVLDATYCQARNMHSSLQKLLKDSMPPAVRLSPNQDSVFHRAQKSYGQAHRRQQAKLQQPKNDVLPQEEGNHQEVTAATTNNDKGSVDTRRVSTAEACGLLLTELGVVPEVEQAIVQAVHINNQAMKYVREQPQTSS